MCSTTFLVIVIFNFQSFPKKITKIHQSPGPTSTSPMWSSRANTSTSTGTLFKRFSRSQSPPNLKSKVSNSNVSPLACLALFHNLDYHPVSSAHDLLLVTLLLLLLIYMPISIFFSSISIFYPVPLNLVTVKTASSSSSQVQIEDIILYPVGGCLTHTHTHTCFMFLRSSW